MAAKPIQGRTTADAGDQGVTVFLIGMRINSWWAVRDWVPVFLAMPAMLAELDREKGLGLLAVRRLYGPPRTLYMVQYWSSHEALLAYAADPGHHHRPAWQRFSRRMRGGRGRVGFWHETYVVPKGANEAVYVNMPPMGLGEAFGAVPVGRRGETAAARLNLDTLD
ncbi:DUF4188 domain-containing protein [Wenjunlia tyrosinilytica]|uniref:DUF4188 domain-containing protein n=1 Tax=Wenjunlia tyrosinilytica TaxID=1544741 RepID=A0A917ZUN1_9ACTN|nr:DUF4188 domain-containing protein [Wenjunlia tyrosinilytica]GGO93905.1 hypothetical protein GCM10012280_47500 [Wenjunlia tyrosinilytica]